MFSLNQKPNLNFTCYKDRLKTHDPATIKSIIEGRMKVEKFWKERQVRLQVGGI